MLVSFHSISFHEEKKVDIIFTPGFGSCLQIRGERRPGTPNEYFAEGIADHIGKYGRRNVVVIAAEPVTVALNSRGIIPDYNVLTSCAGDRHLRGKDFVAGAISWLEHPARRHLLEGPAPLRYLLVAQPVQVWWLMQCFRVYGVTPTLVSRESVPCDPKSEPWFTRSRLYYWIREQHERVCKGEGI
jgi:hypothetical protein